jgi:predicted aconitase with swiveling domain
LKRHAGDIMLLRGRTVSRGKAAGPALVSKDPISFLGGVDPMSGTVIEKGHALYGKCVKGKVLIFPNGKGSTVGSYVIYRLKKNGMAPAAIINISSEPIVAVGAIISGIPMVDHLERDPVEAIKDDAMVTVDGTAGTVEVSC